MNKTILSAAIVSVVSLSSFSVFADGPQIYGRLDLSITHSDNGTTTQNSKSGTVIENNFSRIGVKGSDHLSDDIELLYKIEVQVNGATDSDDVFLPRNTYLGLKSKMGTVLFGRNDTVFKTSKGNAEAFAVTNAGYNRMIGIPVRRADGITYYSPKIAGLFNVHTTYLMGDNYEDTEEEQYAVNIFVGDKKLKKSAYFLSAAYNTIAGYDAYRAVAQVKFYDFKLAGLFQNTTSQSYSNKTGDSYFISAIYNVNGVNLKAEYGKDKAGFGKYFKNSALSSTDYSEATDVNIDSLVVGADYKLSKSTTVYAHFATYSGSYRVANSGPVIELEDDNITSVSLRYNF
ncbi:porin [Shewanella youngdeokensis]|uniref:Porin n=1 Tax=Shewanella youngdeokensis TaxID=2999068 RepID=A0ABZ0K0K2_9GAMM|nr:porin [Shewanella sp. DAU334]